MITPPVLLRYQRAWMEDHSRVRVWEKSRRIGASWTCAVEAAIDGALVGDYGRDTWYTSYNKEVTQEFIRDADRWSSVIKAANSGITEESELDDNGNEVLTYVIRFPSGHRITSLSSKPTNLRNRKGRVIVDEAAFMPDLGETLKAAMAVLMWGGSVDILSTHNGVDSQFARFINDIRAGRKDHSLHRTTIDDAIADGLYKRICLVNGEQWTEELEAEWLRQLLRDYGNDADEELRCVPRRSGGTYLDRLVIEDRMVDVPVFRFEAPEGFAKRPDAQRQTFMLDWLQRMVSTLDLLPKDLMHTLGQDFGRTTDITVIAPTTIMQNLRRHCPFLLEMRDTPFREQELALYFVADRLPRFVYGAIDQGGNGQYLAERAWQRYGEHVIERVNLSDAWYAAHLPPFKAAFDDDMTDAPRDADVLSDLMSFQVINGTPRLPDVRTPQRARPGSTKNPKRHGDAAIALALSHYASRQPVMQEGYASAGKRTTLTGVTVGRSHGFRARSGGVF